MQDKLYIKINSTRDMRWVLGLQSIGAIACGAYALFYPYPLLLSLMMMVVIGYLKYCIKKYVTLLLPSSITHFFLQPVGEGLFYCRNGAVLKANVQPGISYLSEYCMVLGLKSRAAKVRYMVIFKDSLPHFAYQRLLAHIRAIP